MKFIKFLFYLPLLLADPAYGLSREEREEIGIKID